jgi:hypothetical protein
VGFGGFEEWEGWVGVGVGVGGSCVVGRVIDGMGKVKRTFISCMILRQKETVIPLHFSVM